MYKVGLGLRLRHWQLRESLLCWTSVVSWPHSKQITVSWHYIVETTFCYWYGKYQCPSLGCTTLTKCCCWTLVQTRCKPGNQEQCSVMVLSPVVRSLLQSMIRWLCCCSLTVDWPSLWNATQELSSTWHGQHSTLPAPVFALHHLSPVLSSWKYTWYRKTGSDSKHSMLMTWWVGPKIRKLNFLDHRMIYRFQHFIHVLLFD